MGTAASSSPSRATGSSPAGIRLFLVYRDPILPSRRIRGRPPAACFGKSGRKWRSPGPRKRLANSRRFTRPVTQTLWRSLGDSGASAVRAASGTAVGCASSPCRTTDRRPASGRAAIGTLGRRCGPRFVACGTKWGDRGIVPAPWCTGSGDPARSPRHQLHWSGPRRAIRLIEPARSLIMRGIGRPGPLALGLDVSRTREHSFAATAVSTTESTPSVPCSRNGSGKQRPWRARIETLERSFG